MTRTIAVLCGTAAWTAVIWLAWTRPGSAAELGRGQRLEVTRFMPPKRHYLELGNGGPQPATLCALTFICTPLQDSHPTDAGYEVIARQIWAASDYDRLRP
jgi:hypothetical protein